MESGAFPVAASDIALLESSQSFTIFNEFEQPLSDAEKNSLLPYCPMHVIQNDFRLGDQITRAMQCRYRQKTYYLLKDGKGALIGDKNRLRLLKGCTMAEDTVEIVKGGATAFTGKSSQSPQSRVELHKGSRLITLFRYGNELYALQTEPVEQYCWVSASSRESLKRIKRAMSPSDTSISKDLLAQLSQRITAANSSYQTFFGRLSECSGQQKSAPRWSEEAGAPGRAWRLSEPYGHTGELDASTGYLVNDLREILIGKPFSVRYEKGLISIVRSGAGSR
jgi:hypothetical protein